MLELGRERILWLDLYTCPRCGHTIDAENMAPGRGCFGRKDAPHARSERVNVKPVVGVPR